MFLRVRSHPAASMATPMPVSMAISGHRIRSNAGSTAQAAATTPTVWPTKSSTITLRTVRRRRERNCRPPFQTAMKTPKRTPAALATTRTQPGVSLLWASPREILNVVQASETGCHVITVTHDLLKKLGGLGRDLTEFSLDTVKMFHRDAELSGYSL